MQRDPVHHIIKTLGADAISDFLGVSSHSVRYAKTTGRFPASWYDPLDDFCIEVGIPCPRAAFNFRRAAKKPSDAIANGKCAAGKQEQVAK